MKVDTLPEKLVQEFTAGRDNNKSPGFVLAVLNTSRRWACGATNM